MAGFAHRVAAAYERGTIDPRGAWAITVGHDRTCPSRRGPGECTCTPEIIAHDLTAGVVVQIGLDGEALITSRTT